MKTLLLLRHGKSDWEANYVGDHERPLARRGEKAASKVGRFLAGTSQVPELVICSTALRARQTLENAMDAGNWGSIDVVNDKTIYLASYEQLVSCVASIADEYERVMLVGHEPTTSILAGQLIGGASIRFPTAAIARIDLNIDHWKSCRSGIGTMIWHVIPAHLKKTIKIQSTD